MKILMLLIWLVGGEVGSDVLLFDTEQECMDFGNIKIELLEKKHPNVKFLANFCVEVELDGVET